MDCHGKADRLAFRGLDGRDVAFMERLRNLAREALTWEHLSDQQRLVWAAALELDVVPVQETFGGTVVWFSLPVWVCRSCRPGSSSGSTSPHGHQAARTLRCHMF